MRLLPTKLSPGCLGIVAGCCLLIAVGWSLTLERIAFEREEGAQHAMRQNGNLALAFEEHTRRTIKGLDRMVRFIRHEYLEEQGKLDLRYLADEAELDQKAITTAAVIDAKGKVVFSITGNEGGNVADREYFAFHQAVQDDGLRIGQPVTGRFTGRTTIHLTRPLYDRQGRFGGVALVGVDPQYFASFYSKVDLQARGVVLLAGLDGQVRARRAGDLLSFGQDLAGTRLFRELGKAPVGSYSGGRGPDGMLRYVSYRQLKDYPLVVAVGTAQDDVLAGFYERRRNYLTGATLATALVAVFAGLLLLARRRQQLEAAGKLAAEARYRVTFDQAAVGIAHCAPDGRFLCANGAYCRLLGYTEAELRQRRFLDILHEEDRGMAETLRLHFVNGDAQPPVIENRELRKDGTVIWTSVAVSMARDAAGRPDYFIAMVQDISQRKQAEEGLRESEARFRQLAENVREVFWLTDPAKTQVLYVSPAYEQIWGRSCEELSAAPGDWARAIHPGDRERVLRAAQTRQASGEYVEEYRIVRPDGEVRWIRDRAFPVARNGEVYRIAGVAEDITERRLADDALRESEARFRSLTELSSDFYWETDAEHRFTSRGSAGKPSPVGTFAKGSMLGKRRWEIPYLSPGEAGWREHRATLDARLPFRGFELSRRRDDGSEHFVSLSGDPVFDEAGNFTGYRGVGTDITERKRAELQLRESERRFRDMLGKVQLVSLMLDCNARITYCNDYLLELTGWSREEVIGKEWFELFVPLEAGDLRKLFAGLLGDEPGASHHQSPIMTRTGARRLIQWNNTLLRSISGEVIGTASIGEDITERHNAEARYRATFDQSATGIAHTSLEGRFLSVNRKFCRMLGYEERELVGRSVDEVTHPEDRHTTLAAAQHLAYATQDSFVPEYEKRYVCKDGGVVWVSISVCVVRDSHGVPEYFIALANDISSRKQAEEKLFHRAHYDALTDLPNRVLCFDRLSQAIAQAGRKRWAAGVLFMDLDRFKTVNDTLGHASGDAVLRLAAQRLQSCVRAGDTVARVGGDEFVVVMSELKSPQDGAVVAQKIVDAMAKPLRIDGQEVYIGTSIGIATFPADGRDGETLVKNADAAMLRAKQVGRNNFQFYTREMNERALEKLQLDTDLRRALERREFFLHYQPKVSLASGRITGVEALLRWNRPGHGPVSPAQFVPILEDCGLIVPVGDWIVETVCAQVRAWRGAGLAAVPVAVNLAAKQFLHHDIGAVIDAALERHGIPGSLLQIEITESDAMSSPAEVSAMLRGLRERGVTVAIDDFGTGYSSLGYLKRFPLDTLKLDRSFVTGLPGDGDDVSIALAVIGMAHSLGLKVVAEGVEKREQRDFLAAQGCDEMQGYLFSRPVPAEECARLLQRPSAALAA
jgi:diguanylate cyclase (GGDEF)-like protein/PAS domain S-box-containing protein